MFEQDFANQIKMTGKPGEELMKPAISCNIIDMEDSSVEVEYFINLRFYFLPTLTTAGPKRG